MDLTQVSSQWRSRGFGCDIWSDPPGQEWLDYVHAEDELLMLTEGEIEVTVGPRTWRPKLGEEVFIPARTRHSVRNVGTTTNRWYYGYRRL